MAKKQFIISDKDMDRIEDAITSIQTIRFHVMPESGIKHITKKDRKFISDQLWQTMQLLKAIQEIF